MTLTNQTFFFFTRRGLAIARENVGRRPQVLQKSPASKALCRSTCNRVGEAAADEEEEEEQEEEQQEEEQQEDTEDSGGESGDDKCMVCGEKEETLKTGWHVKCVYSGYILSAYPPIISHADFHCHICLQ